MISLSLGETLRDAMTYAQEHRHEYLTTEHLLLLLLDNESANEALITLDADIAMMRSDLLTYLDIEANVPKIALDSDKKTKPTRVFDSVIQRAIFHVRSADIVGKLVEGIDVLVALTSEKETESFLVLQRQGINRLKLTRYLAHGKEVKASSEEMDEDEDIIEAKKASDPLVSYAENLNKKARNGLTDPLIGRSSEVERAAQVLCRRRKNNPLLTGEPGVGKTAIAEGLAWLIVNNKAPAPLQDAVIYSLDIGALVAGTKFRGDFEKRMKQLLKALKKQPNAILFIDEIHIVVGAGSSMNSSMDMSNLIKPALASGELRCIGSTTFSEYRQIFEKDSALSRRFQKIDIQEPSIQDSIEILRGLRAQYEAFHHVHYTDDALVAAAELSAKHIHGRFLPDKAIDVIDEAGAFERLNHTALISDTKKAVVDVTQIESVVSKIARIPPKTVSSDDKLIIKTLAQNLKKFVFGQDKAIDLLSDAIKLSRAGLKPAEKPIGAFMFAGPTGVGKTEVSRQLAYLLGVELVRFDMSEYMEAHTASRLIGAPPGYVGYDQGGLLTEKINQHPHCVLLLDEIEKAHPDVFNLLLQVMDHGVLTDNNGRSASFRQVILIMTTNVGAESLSRTSIGFMEQDNSTDNSEAMKRTFTPEFRNRLDAIVNFAPLNETTIVSVVDKMLVELQAVLDDKKVVLEVNNEVRNYLAQKGYDRLMGARPMARLIQDEIKKPLAEMLLFGELAQGGQVVASLDQDEKGDKCIVLTAVVDCEDDVHLPF